MNNKTFGYCRISTSKQKLDRQIRNIRKDYPDADMRVEVFSGRKSNRPLWKALINEVVDGDTIVFDSVSRMSRDAADGFKTYMELYNRGVNLVFLKEPAINTDAYKSILGNVKLSFEVNTSDEDTDALINGIMDNVAVYITKIAEKQIMLAFEGSEKEVSDLRQRTKEGMREAARKGKQIGREKGTEITTKKSIAMKELIIKYNKVFGGALNDKDTLALIKEQTDGLNRNTFYKYKKELMEEYCRE